MCISPRYTRCAHTLSAVIERAAVRSPGSSRMRSVLAEQSTDFVCTTTSTLPYRLLHRGKRTPKFKSHHEHYSRTVKESRSCDYIKLVSKKMKVHSSRVHTHATQVTWSCVSAWPKWPGLRTLLRNFPQSIFIKIQSQEPFRNHKTSSELRAYRCDFAQMRHAVYPRTRASARPIRSMLSAPFSPVHPRFT